MQEIKASEFKAKCLKLLDQVAATGEEIVITKHGKAVARVVREVAAPAKTLFGCMDGSIEIVDPEDDLLSAFDDEDLMAIERNRERRARILLSRRKVRRPKP
jgi:prevent-host-death family protein